MVVIFIASTDAFSAEHTGSWIVPILRRLFPHLTVRNVEDLHYFVRKCAHFVEYSILGSLLWRAIPEHKTNPEVADWWRACTALLVATFYAATDEYHQSFVPSRTSSVHDVLIDAFGASVAVLIVCLVNRQRARRALVPVTSPFA